MSTVGFDGKWFYFRQNDGLRYLLLNASDIYENHSPVSMGELEPAYGESRQKKPFRETLKESLSSLGSDNMGYILTILLTVKSLWKKPRPYEFLRVGGSLADLLDLRLAEMLDLFCSDSRLWHMCSDIRRPLPKNLLLPMTMESEWLSWTESRFDVLFLDDTAGEISPERMMRLLPALRPFGQFFCLTNGEALIRACQNAMQITRLTLDGSDSLLIRELSHGEWLNARNATERVPMEERRKEAGKQAHRLKARLETLDVMESDMQGHLLQEGKNFVTLLTELYPILASIDTKAYASRFYEALIDWHLGNGTSAQVRKGFDLLLGELLHYHDIPDYTDHPEKEWNS